MPFSNMSSSGCRRWINTLLLAGRSTADLTLHGGGIPVLLNTASGIGVLTIYTAAISQDRTYAVDSITANTTSGVLSNDVAGRPLLTGKWRSDCGDRHDGGKRVVWLARIDARGNYTTTHAEERRRRRQH